MMLSDDDALVSTALERFAHEATHQDADFLFCGVAKYRDASFPGPDKNSVDCPPFSGSSRVVTADEFVRPLFQFRAKVRHASQRFRVFKGDRRLRSESDGSILLDKRSRVLCLADECRVCQEDRLH